MTPLSTGFKHTIYRTNAKCVNWGILWFWEVKGQRSGLACMWPGQETPTVALWLFGRSVFKNASIVFVSFTWQPLTPTHLFSPFLTPSLSPSLVLFLSLSHKSHKQKRTKQNLFFKNNPVEWEGVVWQYTRYTCWWLMCVSSCCLENWIKPVHATWGEGPSTGLQGDCKSWASWISHYWQWKYVSCRDSTVRKKLENKSQTTVIVDHTLKSFIKNYLIKIS